MHIASVIFRNASFLFLARVMHKLVHSAVLILAARYLDVESFGLFSLAIFFGFLCLVLFDGGILSYLVREVSSNPQQARTYYVNGLLVRAIYILATFMVAAFSLDLLDYGATAEQCILILVTSRLFSSLSSHNYSFFRARNSTQYEMYSLSIDAAVLLTTTVLGVVLSLSLIHLCLAWLWGALAGALSSTYFLHRQLKPLDACSKTVSGSRIIGIVRGSAWFGAVGVCAAFYTYGANFFLTKLVSFEVAGIFAAAYNFMFLFALISQAVADGLLPLAADRRVGFEQLQSVLINATRYQSLIIMPLAVGTSTLAEPLIQFFYGEQYLGGPAGQGAEDALLWLSWYGALLSFGYLYGNLLWAIQEHRFLALAGATMVVLSVALNFLLIPEYSLIGAAAVLVTIYALLCGMQVVRLAVRVPLRLLARSAFPAVRAGLLMWVALILARAHFPLLACVFVGGGCYFVMLWFQGVLSRQHMEQVREAFAEIAWKAQGDGS